MAVLLQMQPLQIKLFLAANLLRLPGRLMGHGLLPVFKKRRPAGIGNQLLPVFVIKKG